MRMSTVDSLSRRAVLGNDDVAKRIREVYTSIEAEGVKRPVFEELIERIGAYQRIAHMLRTDSTFRNQISQVPVDVESGNLEDKWRRALSRCYRVLLEEYGPARIRGNSEELRTTLSFFAELASLNSGDLHVFTTSYDCSYQVLANNSEKLKFRTHIDNVTGRFKDQWSLLSG